METAADLDKDIVRDTMMLKTLLEKSFSDKKVPGMIQEFQVSPAKIVLFSYKQMELLKLLQASRPVSLFLDATGSLIRSLGTIYDNKRMLLYTILAKSPRKGNAPIPICEMISSDNRHVAIFTWLYTFFHT